MEMNPWFVLLLGMGTVFVGLFAIILLTKLMSTLMGTKATASEPASKQQAAKAPAPAVSKQTGFPIGDRACFDAVVAAALATYMGTEARGLRIHSIRQLSAEPETALSHGQFVAVIAAALATATGTDASGFRIHSIRKI